jgi:hypothetical protein
MMGKYYSEHELLSNMYDIVDEDGCILTVLDKDTLKTLPPLIPVRQPVHGHWRISEKGEWGTHICGVSGQPWWFHSTFEKYLANYCPQCGARIDDPTYMNSEEMDENTVEHTIMGMKTEVTDETS